MSEQFRNPGSLGLDAQLAHNPPQNVQRTNPGVPSHITKRPKAPASENQPPRRRGRPRKEAVRELNTSEANTMATDTADSIGTQDESGIQATKEAEVPTEAQNCTPVGALAAPSILMGPTNGPPDTLQPSHVVLSGQEHQGLVSLSDGYSKVHRTIRRIKQSAGPVSVDADEPVPEGSPQQLGPGYFKAKLRSDKGTRGETDPEVDETGIKNDVFMGHEGYEAALRKIRRGKEASAREAPVPPPVAGNTMNE